MGRHYLPLMGTASQPVPVGAEMLIAECHHIAPGEASDSDNGFRAATLLANLSRRPQARAVLDFLRHPPPSCRSSVRVVPDLRFGDVLRRSLEVRYVDFGYAVLFTDETAVLDPREMQAVIDSLKDGIGTESCAVLVVCADPMRWSALKGVAGYVVGCRETTEATAGLLFQVMVAQMAPDTITCLDFEDMGFIPDAPETPTTVVQAAWLKEQSRLIWMADCDQSVVSQAKHVTVVPATFDARLEEIWPLVNAIRGCLSPEATCSYSAANLTPSAMLHDGAVITTLLCQRDRKPAP